MRALDDCITTLVVKVGAASDSESGNIMLRSADFEEFPVFSPHYIFSKKLNILTSVFFGTLP